MVNKRAQLSIETMIIYGLVILVALSVIGGLLYFNVLDLGSYLPDKCDLGGSGDLKCEEMKFVGGVLELGVRNIGQKPIDILFVNVTDKSGVQFSGGKWTDTSDDVTYTSTTTNCICPSTGAYTCAVSGGNCVSLPPGEIAKVSIATGGGLSGKLLRGTLKTRYRFNEGAITQETSGTIRIKAS
jgi:hypothetical protein